MIDFGALNAQLVGQADTLLPTWLPGGKFRGHEYVCSDIHGGSGDSFSVNKLSGKWADFADPEFTGGDLVSLYAAINGIDNLEAAERLGAEDRPRVNGHVHPQDDGEDIQIARPPHAEFQASLFKHYKFGAPLAFWIYRDAEGPLMAVARYEPEGMRKQYVPWIWIGTRWLAKAPPKPRPLYGLDRLARLDTAVLLVEGEKAADAGQRFFPGRPVLSWLGGVGGWKHAAWAALQGRQVTLWPDADEPGRQAMAGIAGRLMALDCAVRVVDTASFEDGWDLADGEQEGRTAAELIAYAKAHTREVEPVEDAPLAHEDPPRRVARVQTVAPAEVIQAGPQEVTPDRWQPQYVCKQNGMPVMNTHNVLAALKLRGGFDIRFDEFSNRIMIGRDELSDAHLYRLTAILQRELSLKEIRSGIVKEGIELYAVEHRFDPVKDWLNSLTWDGEDRLERLLPDGFGTAASEYTAAVGKCFLIGMVARVFRPGCKVDSMPIFEGSQGIFKSSALKILGGPYFAEIHESIMSKDFYIAIAGKMLCEISELHAFRRADIERIKGIITTATDRFRSPYGKFAADFPRRCVFAGTTNLDDWNTDETGARRFWPVRCTEISREYLETNRDQLFAESVARFNCGESWWQVPETEAAVQREARRDIDPWESLLERHLESLIEVDIPNLITNVLQLNPRDMNALVQKRVAKILRARGFQSKVTRTEVGIKRKWIKAV
jgi:hypothetical protein